jgi:DNA-binding transcriptional regulator PaaX
MIRVDTTEAVNYFIKLALVGGTISVSMVAPNAAQLFGNQLLKKLGKPEQRAETRRLLRYMKQKNYVDIVSDSNGELVIKLTSKGKEKSKRIDFSNLRIAVPKKWDSRWRIVAFDIPYRHRAAANALTWKLKQLGFQQMQRSIWAHPFPCQEEVKTITALYGIEKYVDIIEADLEESHNKLVQQFSSILS